MPSGHKHEKINSGLLLPQGVPTKASIKKLLVGAAYDFNSQFLNLFGFSISVSFVWCIISINDLGASW